MMIFLMMICKFCLILFIIVWISVICHKMTIGGSNEGLNALLTLPQIITDAVGETVTFILKLLADLLKNLREIIILPLKYLAYVVFTIITVPIDMVLDIVQDRIPGLSKDHYIRCADILPVYKLLNSF